MKSIPRRSPVLRVSVGGTAAVALAVALWWRAHPEYAAGPRIAALISAALFVAVGLRFAPELVRFWSPREALEADLPSQRVPGFLLKLFFALLGWIALVLLISWPLRCVLTGPVNLTDALEAWVCGDGVHYLDIARDWYLSEGSIDRLVQLVFLPGYPLLIRAAHLLIPNWTLSALAVSALCFAGAGCLLYKLLRLDLEHRAAVRGAALLCLTPGSFFFAAPMSESLFLLCCVGCVYLARTGRWLPACLFGAAAAFTRSLGITLVVPLLTELIALRVRGEISGKRMALRCISLILIPAGFGVYCCINYRVAGDPLQFLTYQSEHWSQRLGLFFNSAAYQTEYAVSSAAENPHNLLGLWLPNLTAQALSLGLMIYGAKRMRASYVTWYFVYFCIAIGTTWLLSAPRYLMAFFPAAIALAQLTERKGLRAAVLPVMLGLWIAYFLLFLLRWQVY